MNPSVSIERPFECKKIPFELGQWVDVKDTIDQWLEAQVTKIRGNELYVHYNGWGNHWDEWIDAASPRIAPFRTYTLQYPSSRYLSPAPNIQPDSEDHEIPARLAPNFPEMVTQAQILLEKLQGCLGKFVSVSTAGPENAAIKKQLAAQLAPLLDRTGRLLADFAPHFAHVVDPDGFRDEETAEPLSYRSERPEVSHDTQVPLIANSGDVTIVSNLLDRVIFGDSPSLEVHVHAFLNPPASGSSHVFTGAEPRPQSVSPASRRPFSDVPLPMVSPEPLSREHSPVPVAQYAETEIQTEAVPTCDAATVTEPMVTYSTVGVQAGPVSEGVKMIKSPAPEKVIKSPIRPKIKAHVGHTIIRESPRVGKGKAPNVNGEFRITRTSLKLGPAVAVRGPLGHK